MSKLDSHKAIEHVTQKQSRDVGEDMVRRSFKAWERELEGVTAFLNKLPLMTEVEGEKWVIKTKTYYTLRHNTLVRNHPKLPKGYRLPKLL